MKRVDLSAYGIPEQVASCVDVPDVGAPGQQIWDGALDAPVAKIYPIEEIMAGLAHAQQGERGGKILMAPNGMV